LRAGTANMLVSEDELNRRRADLEAKGGFAYPQSQTPWQEIQRGLTGQMGTGMVLEPAVKYQQVDKRRGIPRDNH
jgi:dihydroxy-acid dehydratase